VCAEFVRWKCGKAFWKILDAVEKPYAA